MPTAHPRTTVAFAISLLRLRAVRGKNESIGKKSFMSDSWGKTKGSVSGPCHLQAAPNPANGATGIKAFAKQTKTGQDKCGLSEHVYLISSYTRIQWHEYFVVIFSTNDISTRPYVFGPGTRWHRYVYIYLYIYIYIILYIYILYYIYMYSITCRLFLRYTVGYSLKFCVTKYRKLCHEISSVPSCQCSPQLYSPSTAASRSCCWLSPQPESSIE